MTNGQEGVHHELRSVLRSVLHGLQLFQLIFRMNKRYTLTSVLLYIIQGIMPVATLIVTQNLLNGVSMAWKQGEAWLITQFALFILVFVMKNVISAVQSYVDGILQTLLSNTLNIMVCEKSTTLGLADYENSEVNDQLKRANQESSYRPYQLYTQMAGIASSLITMLSSAVLLILWKWWVVLVIFIISTISFYSLLKLNREQFRIYMDRTPLNRQTWYMTYLLTNDSAFKEVKLFQLGPYLLNRYRDFLTSFLLVDRRILMKYTRIKLLYDMLEIALLFWLIWLVIQEAFHKEILIGSLYGYIQAITLSQSQMQAMIHGMIKFSQSNLYMEQLLQFLKVPTSDPVQRQKQLLTPPKVSCDESFRIEQISFEGVSFRYSGQSRDTIRNLHFTLAKGQTIAIVGKNGSGKSTLVKLLMQLYADYQGVIKVNGHNILDYDLQQIQERIGIVFQDFVHYEMSVRHNIGFGSMDKLEQDEQLLDAAKCAAIDQTIKQLPYGLDTQLGRWFEEGFQLSGGQWQRIAIARAFFRSADVYILDEPTSFLDPLAEQNLLQLFQDLMKERMAIFITHRISSARLADKILVMDNGQIVEQGTHAELIKLDGIYSQMYRVQASSFTDEGVGVEYAGGGRK
ncbi:ATP-binding cassette, subfamily B [Paenibacillus tianmuensis]|uniref:ATP-binding cassette, subfamily B n=1 Tax=Paenibacillus tianmuensis TaxID=624147 RepID=A0A1G4S337_9BACL|nr:ABC transporter ATP-binding protein [Paenibacillus tianmuensis]SCW63490.1 ATP-binding cassette, subfamily B [Paenibacillus tianmuensis]